MQETRVLFVDDEPNVISGLRRLLRGFRNEWRMEFATDPAAAISNLKSGSFDVIVTDMRMPKIDGAQVLQAVKDFSPHSVRIVLSGQAEHDRIFHTIETAHLFLSKPCASEGLKQTITRACSLRDRLANDELKQVISTVSTVPAQPDVLHRLRELLQRESTTIEEISILIASDVGLTAKLLQLVSSSFFGQPRRIQHPIDAVNLLGLELIRELTLSTSTFVPFELPGFELFSIKELNRHSLEVAQAASNIAAQEVNDPEVVGEAFIAGMLHDIGKIVLAAAMPEPYQDAVRLANGKAVPLWQAEAEIFGVTHSEVGAYLLGLWGISDPIVEAIQFCRDPEQSLSHGMHPLMAVHAANTLRRKEISYQPTQGFPDNSPYLRSSEFANRLEQWQKVAGQIGSNGGGQHV